MKLVYDREPFVRFLIKIPKHIGSENCNTPAGVLGCTFLITSFRKKLNWIAKKQSNKSRAYMAYAVLSLNYVCYQEIP